MKERWLGYALLALGGLSLLPSGGYAAWFWIGLVAAGFLLAYVARRNYGFLLVGCVLTGVSVGFLLEGVWNWHGAFLISLGVGFSRSTGLSRASRAGLSTLRVFSQA